MGISNRIARRKKVFSMYITNIWGLFFMVYVPMIIATILAYLEGQAEGRRKYGRRNYYTKSKFAKQNRRPCEVRSSR